MRSSSFDGLTRRPASGRPMRRLRRARHRTRERVRKIREIMKAFALAGVATAVALMLSSLDRGAVARAIKTAVETPAALLAARSPGERPAGALALTKQRVKPQVRRKPPTERVLAQERYPAAPIAPPLTIEPTPVFLPDVMPANPFVPPVIFSPAPSPLPIPPTPFPIPPSGPGGGGAVPEPATWAMLIVGFLAIGTALRRARAAAAPLLD